MADDISIPDNNESRKQISVKKKRTKEIVIASIIAVLIPVILALFYTLNPADSIISSDKITIDDFSLEMFAQGYDQLCQRDDEGYLVCVLKNDGNIEVINKDGIIIFQTKDYSLLKNYGDEFGYGEETISSAFYSDKVNVKEIQHDGLSLWLVSPKGYQ